MIHEFYNQEPEYAQFLATGEAFVLNDNGGTMGRVHRGDCAVLNRAGPATGGRHTSVRKICSNDLEELRDHLGGKIYEHCAFCFVD